MRLGILQCHAMLRYVAVEQKQTLMLKLRGGCLELCKQFASQVRAISQQRSCHMAVKHHTGASSTACYCQHLYRNLRYKSWEATEKEKKKRAVTDSAGQGGLGEQWRCVTNCCIRRLTDCARLSSPAPFLAFRRLRAPTRDQIGRHGEK